MASSSNGGLSEAELSAIYDFAVQLTKDAGQRLADGARARMAGGGVSLDAQEKDSSVDLVTQADEDVEAFVKAAITERYPTHHFLGEESYSKGSSRDYLVADSERNPHPTWIVDPLDGTVNYTHLFAMYCVSIGFVIGGRPVIGVIYAPMLNQLFSACRGKGAWLNETTRLPLMHNPAIPPLPANAPSGCIFSCEWGKDRRDVEGGNLSRKVESFVTMATERSGRNGRGGMVHGVRSLGSAAMDLAYTAAGSFDIWWEGGCWEWDVAAGFAILEEAGGLVTTANPPASATGDYTDVPVEPAHLGGRLYLAIRPAGPSVDKDRPENAAETGRAAQERVVREVWKRVASLDYTRPGV